MVYTSAVLGKDIEYERALDLSLFPTQGPEQHMESAEVDDTREKTPLDESWLGDDSRDTELVDSANLSQGVQSSTQTVDVFVQLGDHDDNDDDDLQEVCDHHETFWNYIWYHLKMHSFFTRTATVCVVILW